MERLQTANLLPGEEQAVYADAGYTGADKRVGLKGREVTWRIAMKRGKLEHSFHVVKNRFGHRKVRYKGLEKNTGPLYVLFALANLVIAKKALLA